MDDKISMIRLSKGDENTYQDLFTRYYSKVYFFLLGILKSKPEAEDLAQDVFIKIWMNRSSFGEVRDFEAYLYVLARNTLYSFLRSRHLFSVSMDEAASVVPVETVTPQDELVANDLRLLVDLIVTNMPSQRKLIYRLSREQGIANDKIAEQLGISKKTVENHLNIALKEIRDAIAIYLLILNFWV